MEVLLWMFMLILMPVFIIYGIINLASWMIDTWSEFNKGWKRYEE
jgi:hypothetical protein